MAPTIFNTKRLAEAASNDAMTTLRAELDQELAFLREPQTAGKLRHVFGAGTDELARAANAAASRKS